MVFPSQMHTRWKYSFVAFKCSTVSRHYKNKENKAVLEPWVSPSFAITYFCNHCNIRFDPTPVKVICVNLPKDHSWSSPMKRHYWPSCKTFSHKGNNLKWPLDDLWSNICWCLMCDFTQGSLCPTTMAIQQSVWIHWLFFKNLTKRSMTLRWPLSPRWSLTPSLLRSHVWLNARIIVSKSHENTSKYIDTVTLFSKT